MTDYREILRLLSLGINHSQIAQSMGISRQTVVTALQRAAAQRLDWQVSILAVPGCPTSPTYSRHLFLIMK